MYVCVFSCQSQNQIEEERERVNASIASLEEELESSRDRGERWRMQLDATAQELQKTAQESVTAAQHNINIIHTYTGSGSTKNVPGGLDLSSWCKYKPANTSAEVGFQTKHGAAQLMRESDCFRPVLKSHAF